LEVGKAVKMIPSLILECESSEIDFIHLLQLAEIFGHPLQLIFRAGKNLLLNGVEVYKEISAALKAYSSA